MNDQNNLEQNSSWGKEPENSAGMGGGNLAANGQNGSYGDYSYRYQPPAGRNDHTYSSPNYGGQNPPNYGGYSYGQPSQSRENGDQWNFPQYGAEIPKPVKRKKRGFKVFLGLMCSVLVIAVLGFAAFGIYSLVVPQTSRTVGQEASGSTSPDTTTPPAENENVPPLQTNDKPSDNTIGSDGILTTAQINEKVAPSVVGIVQYQSNYFSATGEGSGIILSEDGYIATNAHVIEGADSIEVVLYDGTTYEGRLMGSDTKTDLAVVKIEASGLTPAELGISGQLKVGEKAVAIGNPGGLVYAGSVSEGIISGLNRSIRASDSGYTLNFIQTDAAISPGNSGGALVNEFGQVVGINSQKLSQSGYEGIGFAIPIDEALPILEDLMRYGRVTGRVKLGINAYAINEYVAGVNGIPSGILIDTIESDSSLLAAGVQEGDIITHVEGTPVNSFAALSDLLREYQPGDTVTLTMFRPARRNSGNYGYGYGYGYQSIEGETFEAQITLMEDTGTAASANE